MNKGNKTKQDRGKTWILPEDQMKEFLWHGIDYDKLCKACEHDQEVIKSNKKTKKTFEFKI
jgi:hypothetical protein